MSDYPFEDERLRQARHLRQGSQTSPGVLGYSGPGKIPTPVAGDATGPYLHTLGRASDDIGTDGAAGVEGGVSVADGQPQRLLLDRQGRVWTRLSAGDRVARSASAGAQNSLGLLVTENARLLQLRVIVPAGQNTDLFVQLFDRAPTGTPSNGTKAEWELFLPASTGPVQGADSWDPLGGMRWRLGCWGALSTTPGTLTLATGNSAWWYTTSNTVES